MHSAMISVAPHATHQLADLDRASHQWRASGRTRSPADRRGHGATGSGRRQNAVSRRPAQAHVRHLGHGHDLLIDCTMPRRRGESGTSSTASPRGERAGIGHRACRWSRRSVPRSRRASSARRPETSETSWRKVSLPGPAVPQLGQPMRQDGVVDHGDVGHRVPPPSAAATRSLDARSSSVAVARVSTWAVGCEREHQVVVGLLHAQVLLQTWTSNADGLGHPRLVAVEIVPPQRREQPARLVGLGLNEEADDVGTPRRPRSRCAAADGTAHSADR